MKSTLRLANVKKDHIEGFTRQIQYAGLYAFRRVYDYAVKKGTMPDYLDSCHEINVQTGKIDAMAGGELKSVPTVSWDQETRTISDGCDGGLVRKYSFSEKENGWECFFELDGDPETVEKLLTSLRIGMGKKGPRPETSDEDTARLVEKVWEREMKNSTPVEKKTGKKPNNAKDRHQGGGKKH